PMFPYACIKGPTVRIKTQVKWTKDVSPFPANSNTPQLGGAPGGGALPSNPQTDLPMPSSPPAPTPVGAVGAGGVTPGVTLGGNGTPTSLGNGMIPSGSQPIAPQ